MYDIKYLELFNKDLELTLKYISDVLCNEPASRNLKDNEKISPLGIFSFIMVPLFSVYTYSGIDKRLEDKVDFSIKVRDIKLARLIQSHNRFNASKVA